MASAIDTQRLVTRLKELCAIRAPSRRERPVRDYVHAYWSQRRDSGLTWKESAAIPGDGDTANILMTIPGNTEPLLLCAHMDTVPVRETESIAVLEKDGVLRSDGTTILGGDDRAGIALALEMIDLCLALPAEARPSLEILFTVQEEIGCLGSRDHGFPELRSKTCYNLDGETPPGSIITAAPYKDRFSCDVRGRSSHAALEPELGRNAIRYAAQLILALPQGRVDGETTMNIGSISGGGQTNVVPDKASFTGELRSFSEGHFNEMKNLIGGICTPPESDEGYSAELIWEHLYDGYDVPPEAPVVRRFRTACGAKNIEPELIRSAGGGDANNLNAQGISTVVFGVGMHEIHSTGEYLVIAEYLTASQLLAEVLFSTRV
ncbi:M20/M25/M40 family metallo-hydrolase [Breznakiella homolactica]|uniref:M20/M25/M40 family metallo-hydrolase n=1 Tax=Breznakiella homolactica TaxID=2798577 RepID=A0A7T7XMY8_9SPIR|nr:M20/M25/M40 family metallo-hydrolase [Breznakiella homolactica]QQO09193.1 M20/M25/M40 family metallo-hydrolase [Breznakiella homolactica]